MAANASRGWYAAVAGPALLLAALEAAFLVGGLADAQIRWPVYTLNLAEATAVRDTAEVARQLEDGADPNRRVTVRAGLLARGPVASTPLEAAVFIRRTELIRLLHQHGARLDPDAWNHATCYASRLELGEIVAALAPFAPPAAPLTCAGNEELWSRSP